MAKKSVIDGDQATLNTGYRALDVWEAKSTPSIVVSAETSEIIGALAYNEVISLYLADTDGAELPIWTLDAEVRNWADHIAMMYIAVVDYKKTWKNVRHAIDAALDDFFVAYMDTLDVEESDRLESVFDAAALWWLVAMSNVISRDVYRGVSELGKLPQLVQQYAQCIESIEVIVGYDPVTVG